MNKTAQFIVKKRKIILSMVLLITIVCGYLVTKVDVNYDMSKYLPKETDTSIGLDIMEKEFGLIGNAQVMVSNINQTEALNVYNKLLGIKGIISVEFDVLNTNNYKDKNALYLITLDSHDYSSEAKDTLNNVKEELNDYDISMAGGAVSANFMNDTLQNEIPYFAVIAVILICAVLLLISHSWIEPLLFLSVSGIAIIINYGTNIIFGEVSFVTFAIAALLQLALSMDYSIMLLDKYHHEAKSETKFKAMEKALRKSFNTISSSSLTTIFGLLAMVFMSFAIGKDLGIVLAKGIFINVLVVFIALPALVLMLDNILTKTKKKSIDISVFIFTKLGISQKYIISILMIVLLVGSYFVQSNLKLDYSYNITNEQIEKINDKFGKSNQMVLLYKNDNTSNEVNKILGFLNSYKINNKPVLNSVVDYYNTSNMELSSEEIAKLANMDVNFIKNIFAMYNGINQTNNEKIALNSFITFVIDNLTTNDNYKNYFDQETLATLNTVKLQLDKSEELLKGNEYNRMIIKLDLDTESDETYQFYNDLKTLTKDNLSKSYILGETALSYDIKETFGNELIIITLITVISMIIIIALTFKSLALPLILVALIQGAIWISMSIPVITNKSLFFLALIIAQCIQMGATIDYAILLSSNYVNNRAKQNKKDALNNALRASILTIFTSASILIIATFTIAFVSSQDLITTICLVIGRGTIISSIIVLIVLPSYLILCDRYIEKTTRKAKFLNEDK